MENKWFKRTAIILAAALVLSVCPDANSVSVAASTGSRGGVSRDESTESRAGARRFALNSRREYPADDIGAARGKNGTAAPEAEEISASEAFSLEKTASSGDSGSPEAVEETVTDETPSDETTSETPSEEETTLEETTPAETVPGVTTEPATEETTTAEPATEEPTTADYVIIDELYKVKQGVLVEYLGGKKNPDITKLSIPAEIKVIDKEVFLDCVYIKEVKFQSNSLLKEIGAYAFKGCDSLSLVILPEGLETIGYRAFGSCKSLTDFTVPNTVTVATEIFGTNNAVKRVIFEEGMTKIPAEVLQYAESVESVSVGFGVTLIAKHAFYHCENLKSFEMPDTVTTIKASAFNGCTSLESVTTSAKLKTIGANVFKNCVALKTLELGRPVSLIERNAFTGDSALVLLVYANSYAKAFARQNGLPWDYAPSEKLRRAANTAIWQKFMSLINVKNKSRFPLKKLKNYVPQGICALKKYVVVSAYHQTLKKNSVLLLYDKSTGAYVKKVLLPSFDHVGAVTNVEDRLVVSLNNTPGTDYAAVIDYNRLKKIRKGRKISYDYTVNLGGSADFSGYDGKVFWAGASANVSNARMNGYQVKVKRGRLKFKKKYSFIVPKNTQGVVVEKAAKGTRRTFTFAQSYGRLNNSSLITYSVRVKKAKALGTPTVTRTLPSMLEGISLNGKWFYLVFESGAGLYCGNPDNTSEIQIKNACKLKYAKLSKLT